MLLREVSGSGCFTKGKEDSEETAELDLFGTTFVPFATFCETAGFDCSRSNHRERKDHKTGFEEHEVKRERSPLLRSSRSLLAGTSETGQPF